MLHDRTYDIVSLNERMDKVYDLIQAKLQAWEQVTEENLDAKSQLLDTSHLAEKEEIVLISQMIAQLKVEVKQVQ